MAAVADRRSGAHQRRQVVEFRERQRLVVGQIGVREAVSKRKQHRHRVGSASVTRSQVRARTRPQ